MEENFNQSPANQPLVISSKKKWLWLGILVAVANPVFAGLLVGALYLSEPALRKEGRLVAGIAIIWGAFLFYLASKNLVVKPFIF